MQNLIRQSLIPGGHHTNTLHNDFVCGLLVTHSWLGFDRLLGLRPRSQPLPTPSLALTAYNLSERSISCYLRLFQQTGDVVAVGEFERMITLGAHAQRGYGSWVYLSVTLHLTSRIFVRLTKERAMKF